jgi:hypothetical protein
VVRQVRTVLVRTGRRPRDSHRQRASRQSAPWTTPHRTERTSTARTWRTLRTSTPRTPRTWRTLRTKGLLHIEIWVI